MGSKEYSIAVYPQDEFYFDFIINDNKKNWFDLVNENNLYGIVNLGYFSLSDFSFQNNTKHKGTWLYGPSYQDHGIAIDENGKMSIKINKIDISTMTPIDDLYSYTSGCPPMVLGGVDQDRGVFTANGNTMIGLKPNSDVVILMCDKDVGQTSDMGIQILKEAGCCDIIRMDGSWSTQGRLAPGEVIQPSQMRIDKYYLAIYKKNFEGLRSKIKVTIDPFGFSDKENNPSIWKICKTLQKTLIEQGIEARISHYTGSNLPDSIRAKQSNCWKSDYLISISENSDISSDIRIITSAAGSTAARNKIASRIEAEFINSSYTVANRIYSSFTILASPSAPAGLLQFNSNLNFDADDLVQEFVDCIAKAIAKYFGLDWIEKPVKELSDFELYKKAGNIPEEVKENDPITWGQIIDFLQKINLI